MVKSASLVARNTIAKYPIRNKLESVPLSWKGQEDKHLALSCLSFPLLPILRTSHPSLHELENCCQVFPFLHKKEPGMPARIRVRRR
jgi:hypothetical protein